MNTEAFIKGVSRLRGIEYDRDNDDCIPEDDGDGSKLWLITPAFASAVYEYVNEKFTSKHVDSALHKLKVIKTFGEEILPDDEQGSLTGTDDLYDFLNEHKDNINAAWIFDNWDELRIDVKFGYGEEEDTEFRSAFYKFLQKQCKIQVWDGGMSHDDIAKKIFEKLQSGDSNDFKNMCKLWIDDCITGASDFAMFSIGDYTLTNHNTLGVWTNPGEVEKYIVDSPGQQEHWGMKPKLYDALAWVMEYEKQNNTTIIHYNHSKGLWYSTLDLGIWHIIADSVVRRRKHEPCTWDKCRLALILATRKTNPNAENSMFSRIKITKEAIDDIIVSPSVLLQQSIAMLKKLLAPAPGPLEESVDKKDYIKIKEMSCDAWAKTQCDHYTEYYPASTEAKLFCSDNVYKENAKHEIEKIINEIEKTLSKNSVTVFKSAALNIINEITLDNVTPLPGGAPKNIKLKTPVGHKSQGSGSGGRRAGRATAATTASATGTCSIKSGVSTRNEIEAAWGWVCKFLPSGAQLSSGYRSPEEQKKLIKSKLSAYGITTDNTGATIDPSKTYDDKQYKDWADGLTDAGYKIAAKSFHSGMGGKQAFDISASSGADLRKIAKALKKLSKNSNIGFKCETGVNQPLIEDDPGQMAVHVVFKPAAIKPVDHDAIKKELESWTS